MAFLETASPAPCHSLQGPERGAGCVHILYLGSHVRVGVGGWVGAWVAADACGGCAAASLHMLPLIESRAGAYLPPAVFS